MVHFTSTFELPENDVQLDSFPFDKLPEGACVVAMIGIDLEEIDPEYDKKSGKFMIPGKMYGDVEAAKTAQLLDIQYGSENYNALFYVTDKKGEFLWEYDQEEEEIERLA